MLGKFVGTSLGIAVVGMGLAMTTANARTVPLTQLTMVEESADTDVGTNDDSSTSEDRRHYGGYYGGGYRYHGGYYGGYRYHGGYYGGYRHHGGYYGGYRYHGGYYGGGYRHHGGYYGGYHPRSATGEELGQMNLPQPRVEMD